MKFGVVSVFPEMLEHALKFGVVGQALQAGLLELITVNPRRFAEGVHQAVDDRPFGGGDGMVLSAEPFAQAIEELKRQMPQARVYFLSARGPVWKDSQVREKVRELEAGQGLILVCGRYGGFDQRLVEAYGEELSIGDYVLSGGEIAALAVIDSLSRFLPQVLGNAASSEAESFAEGGLEHPQFTRPREWRGQAAPEVLLSGHHAQIERWRWAAGWAVTAQNRPDLLGFLSSLECAEISHWVRSQSAEDLQICGLKDPTPLLSHLDRRGRP